MGLSPKAIADLVPDQAGIRFCRCPACDAPEADDPLSWSVSRPKELICRRCGVSVPNDKYPAPDEKKKIPEDTIEVLVGVTHRYPYHEVEPEHQRFPGERLYIAARCDDAAREFLAKASLYAAVRHHEQPPGNRDPALAIIAAVVLVRFAQVYPSYSAHYDQPSSLKYFDRADLPPPYRRGYQTAKWSWNASEEVPLNLLIAYALLRGDPALREAGRLLNEADPGRLIEENLLRASARFVQNQTDELNEASLLADRGILAVGRVLNDPELVRDALARLDRFAERGFSYDGFWAEGSFAAHERVVAQLDGWFTTLLAGYSDRANTVASSATEADTQRAGLIKVPMLALAHAAGSIAWSEPRSAEVRQASWPALTSSSTARGAALLGGTGLARLAVGTGEDALDIELRGLDAPGPDRIRRQALRLAVGGRTVLGDLDETAGTPSGFDRASVSHNTVVVDGLNQRESLARANTFAPSGNFLFFAADPDLQVATLDDPRAYPQSTSRYRQTIVLSAGPKSRYGLSVFEVHGGLQHDQIFHAPAGSVARWSISAPMTRSSESLLPQGRMFVPNARPEDGRWFVQALGEFAPLAIANVAAPVQARLLLNGPALRPSGVILHILVDSPLQAVTAVSPGATPIGPAGSSESEGRGSLILRRRSENGASLRTTFVTLFEPLSNSIPSLTNVSRVPSSQESVVVAVETADGPEHLVVNLNPGKTITVRLADSRVLVTDGLVVKVSALGLAMAGGTFAQSAGETARQSPARGRIVRAVRHDEGRSRGWFDTDVPLPEPGSLTGRTVLVRHRDATTRGWTLDRVVNSNRGARLYVREEPGFLIDESEGTARYYHYPPLALGGPHMFSVGVITRGVKTGPR
jgi:hypothetical protein